MTPRQRVEAYLAAMEPVLRGAFLAAVEDIRSTAQLALIVGHLEAGRVDMALAALNLRAEFFGPLDDALRQAYYAGGVAAVAALPAIADPFAAGGWSSDSTSAIPGPSATLPNDRPGS